MGIMKAEPGIFFDILSLLPIAFRHHKEYNCLRVCVFTRKLNDVR